MGVGIPLKMKSPKSFPSNKPRAALKQSSQLVDFYLIKLDSKITCLWPLRDEYLKLIILSVMYCLYSDLTKVTQ